MLYYCLLIRPSRYPFVKSWTWGIYLVTLPRSSLLLLNQTTFLLQLQIDNRGQSQHLPQCYGLGPHWPNHPSAALAALSGGRRHCRSSSSTSFLHHTGRHVIYFRRFEVVLKIKRKSSLFWKDPFYKVPSTGLLRGAFSPTSTTASAVLPQWTNPLKPVAFTLMLSFRDHPIA